MDSTKKGLMIGVIIIIIILAIAGYFIFVDVGDSRGEIERLYYENQIVVCDDAVAEGFDSEEHCRSSIKCFSKEVASVIREDDLALIVDGMKNDDPGRVFSLYSLGAPEVAQAIWVKWEICLA